MDKTIRIGIFGAWRGGSMAKQLKLAGAEIVAVCDHNPARLESARAYLAEGGKLYANFDEFIEHPMDGVYVANYFDQHVPYIVRLLDRGISACTEPICGGTMADCVALVRAVERNRGRAIFMFGENYQFAPAIQEMRRVYATGDLGELMYAHGEYVHPASANDRCKLAPGRSHWRNYLPATYYNSHSLAPLMYVTDTMPRTITAQAVHVEEYHKNTARMMDPCGMMMTTMDNGAVFTTCGCMGGSAHGNWYRFACYRGSMETTRFKASELQIRYNSFTCPEGVEQTQIYTPEPPFDAEIVKGAGHGGGDYYVAHAFLTALRTGEEPYFDVYRGTAIAAVALLGWRSALEGGKPYAIPDFRREEDLAQWEADTLSPFPDRDGNRTLPSMIKSDWVPNPDDVAHAHAIWDAPDFFDGYSWP